MGSFVPVLRQRRRFSIHCLFIKFLRIRCKTVGEDLINHCIFIPFRSHGFLIYSNLEGLGIILVARAFSPHAVKGIAIESADTICVINHKVVPYEAAIFRSFYYCFKELLRR